MICRKCGTNNAEGNNFCVKCGSDLNFKSEPRNTNKSQNVNTGSIGYTYKDLLPTALLAIFIPFYCLYLMYKFQEVFYNNKKSTLTPGKLLLIELGGAFLSFILCIIIIGFFGILAIVIFNIYWLYKAATFMKEDGGNQDLPILCLLFGIFFQPAAYILLQNEANKLAGNQNLSDTPNLSSEKHEEKTETSNPETVDAEVVDEETPTEE